MAVREPAKEKDISQIVRFLTNTFNQATANLERATRKPTGETNVLYKMQTEFAYLLNEVAMCPACVVQKHIAACNEYIDETVQMMNREY